MVFDSQRAQPLLNEPEDNGIVNRWESKTRIFSAWNIFLVGIAIFVAIFYKASTRINMNIIGANLTQNHIDNRNILVEQFKSVTDPKRDICDDPVGFYCGKFIKSDVLPEGVPIETWGFTQIEDKMAQASLSSLQLTCQDALADKSLDEWSQFKVCSMDLCKLDGMNDPLVKKVDSYDSEGIQIVQQYLPILTIPVNEIYNLTLSNDMLYKQFLAESIAHIHNLGNNTLFELVTKADVLFRNGLYNLKLLGGNLFYPNKNQYEHSSDLSTLADYHKILFKYYLENIQNIKISHVQLEARLLEVLLLERRLARIKLSQELKRDKYATNLLSDVETFKLDLGRIIDLDKYIQVRNSENLSKFFRGDSNPVIHEDIKYLKNLVSVVLHFPRQVVIDYLTIVSMDIVADHLSVDARAAKAKWLLDTKGEISGNSERDCQKWVADKLQWVIGRDIVKDALKEGAEKRREKASFIVNTVKGHYYEKVKDAWWMDQETKDGAIAKLNNMKQQVGWPDWLLDEGEDGYRSYFKDFYLDTDEDSPDMAMFSDLNKMEQNTASNLFMILNLKLLSAKAHNEINSVNKIVDLTVWSMPPQDVNAEYFTHTNHFILPWGVIQAPLMYPWQDGPFETEQENLENLAFKAASFGAIGAVTAHEIMHSFDDEGRCFDANGQLHGFSTKKADNLFNEISECIKEEYAFMTVKVKDKLMHLNGITTLGENLADNGGVQVIDSLIQSGHVIDSKYLDEAPLTKYGIDLKLADLPVSMFGIIWCEKSTDAFQQAHLNADPHAPGNQRILGVMSNLQSLSQRQQCRRGTNLNPNTPTSSSANDMMKDFNNRTQCRIW